MNVIRWWQKTGGRSFTEHRNWTSVCIKMGIADNGLIIILSRNTLYHLEDEEYDINLI
jgi:hypothetical protein